MTDCVCAVGTIRGVVDHQTDDHEMSVGVPMDFRLRRQRRPFFHQKWCFSREAWGKITTALR